MASENAVTPAARYVVAPGCFVATTFGPRQEGAEIGPFDLTSAELQLYVQQGRVIRSDSAAPSQEGV